MTTASQTRLAQPVQTQVTTNPYVGILAVFMGAGLATLNSRLLSVGLPDLRGALGFSFDAASWIPTALNMATMFSGVFVVFLNAFWGPRRILLPAAAIFMVASILPPFAPNYSIMLALVVISGLVSGTFYSLTMTFVLTTLPKRLIIFGIAAYAADIVFVSNIASLIEGWYIEHLSWHWIFWNAALFAPLMMLCVYFGIPRRPVVDPRPSWRGFTYFSLGLALLYGALDQGERLYWLHSGVIVAMLVAGVFLLGAAWVRRIVQPNPILKLDFLNTRNIIILALSIFVFKFVHLATIVLVPGLPGQHSKLPASGDGPHACLGGFADVRGGMARGREHHLHQLTADPGSGAHAGCSELLDLCTPRYFVGGKQLRARGASARDRAGVFLRRPCQQHRFRWSRSGCVDQRRECGHILRIHAFYSYFRRPGRCSDHDPFDFGARAISLQPIGAQCAGRQLAHCGSGAGAKRRIASRFHWARRGSTSRGGYSEPTSASSGILTGKFRRIHPDWLGGGRIFTHDAAPETRLDQLQGLKQHALNHDVLRTRRQ